jgi:hypothetical protein
MQKPLAAHNSPENASQLKLIGCSGFSEKTGRVITINSVNILSKPPLIFIILKP